MTTMCNTAILCSPVSFVGISLSTPRAFLPGTSSRARGGYNTVLILNGFELNPRSPSVLLPYIAPGEVF